MNVNAALHEPTLYGPSGQPDLTGRRGDPTRRPDRSVPGSSAGRPDLTARGVGSTRRPVVSARVGRLKQTNKRQLKQ